MLIITCCDSRGGVAFNHRRLDWDKEAVERVLDSAVAQGYHIVSTEYTAKQLSADFDLYKIVSEWGVVVKPDIADVVRFSAVNDRKYAAFIDAESLAGNEQVIDELHLIRWDERFAADKKLGFDSTEGWDKTSEEEIQTTLHKNIKIERYNRNVN